jgi:DNA-directed RNA polymerase specialized sigma24 family protein
MLHLRSTNAPNMPNNSADNLNDDEGVTRESFAALLEALCPGDPEEGTRRYLRLHQKLAGYFRLRGTSDPGRDADDTLDRAGQKIIEGGDIPEVDRFCFGIARNIILERGRDKKKEESAYLEYLDRSHDNSTEVLVDQIMNLMKPCFERLPEDDRDLLTSYCKVPLGSSRAEHRRKLAKSLKSSISALRIRVTRLRRALEDCVKALRKKR